MIEGIPVLKKPITFSFFYLLTLIPFPNPNCYSYLVLAVFEGVLTGLPMLEQPKVRLP
jgi:hypothetical protein